MTPTKSTTIAISLLSGLTSCAMEADPYGDSSDSPSVVSQAVTSDEDIPAAAKLANAGIEYRGQLRIANDFGTCLTRVRGDDNYNNSGYPQPVAYKIAGRACNDPTRQYFDIFRMADGNWEACAPGTVYFQRGYHTASCLTLAYDGSMFTLSKELTYSDGQRLHSAPGRFHEEPGGVFSSATDPRKKLTNDGPGKPVTLRLRRNGRGQSWYTF